MPGGHSISHLATLHSIAHLQQSQTISLQACDPMTKPHYLSSSLLPQTLVTSQSQLPYTQTASQVHPLHDTSQLTFAQAPPHLPRAECTSHPHQTHATSHLPNAQAISQLPQSASQLPQVPSSSHLPHAQAATQLPQFQNISQITLSQAPSHLPSDKVTSHKTLPISLLPNDTSQPPPVKDRHPAHDMDISQLPHTKAASQLPSTLSQLPQAAFHLPQYQGISYPHNAQASYHLLSQAGIIDTGEGE